MGLSDARDVWGIGAERQGAGFCVEAGRNDGVFWEVEATAL